jgi:NADP-dependent 3-hydroxy acid dehydrogenase YdfG
MDSKDQAGLSLKGRRILITGGTTGIGRACMIALAGAGAKVLTFGRHEPELNDALEDARRQGGDVCGLVADVSRREDVQKVFAEADRQLGGLDVLINNAAVKVGTAQETPEEAWRYAVETDFVGYLACVAPALERIERNGAGHLVFIGSMSEEFRNPSTSIYTGIKAGIEAYAKTLRQELVDKGIHVSLVEPGLVGADLQGIPLEKQREREAKQEMIYAEDIADAVRFVLSRPGRVDISRIQIEPLKQKAA